jgi:hypothetical protein
MMMLSSQAASRRLAQARLLRSFTSTKPLQSDQPYDVVVIGTLIHGSTIAGLLQLVVGNGNLFLLLRQTVFPLYCGMINSRSAFDNVQVVGLEVTLPRSRPARYVSSIDPCCCFPAFDQLGLTSRPYLLAGCIYIDGT